YQPLAGLYAEVMTYNQVNQTLSVSGKQMTTIGGSVGGNLQVMTGDVQQRLQNLSEVANNLTSVFQGLPTSIVSLNGTLTSPAPAAGGADVPIPNSVTKLITDNGNQYSASLAYRSTGNGSVYQLVVSGMVPVQGAPAVTNNGYVAATGTGGYVIGTVDVSTNPPTFAGTPAQLTPTTANAQPGVVKLLGAFTAGLSGTAGVSAPTAVTANDATTLFTQSSGAVPNTTLALTGAQLPATGVEQFQDSAASSGFTITSDNGNQYTATIAFRPKTPGANGSGYDVVVTSLTPIGSSPGVASLNYTAGVAATSAGTGGLVIGSYDSSTNPPTFFSTGAMTAIPAASTLPSKFPGHLEPITAITGVTTGAITAGTTVTATNNITSPYYAGNIQLSPTVNLRALQVGDIFKNTTQDNNVGAAQSAASALLNQVMNFSTSGIAGSQTLQNGSAAMIVGIGQDLSTATNKTTELTTAATQIQQAIAPNSEVNLDTEMSKLVVLQTAYQANAKVVTTVTSLLDTLINLVQP
ncbi:MAG: hypothetical protein JO021_17170, partial [Alphaproteobacteria bacterium]|nr:hypothetical protein [Alphaproteobacteria bacterium]